MSGKDIRHIKGVKEYPELYTDNYLYDTNITDFYILIMFKPLELHNYKLTDQFWKVKSLADYDDISQEYYEQIDLKSPLDKYLYISIDHGNPVEGIERLLTTKSCAYLTGLYGKINNASYIIYHIEPKDLDYLYQGAIETNNIEVIEFVDRYLLVE